MEPETQERATDRPCPIAFVILPAFVGAMLWLWAILGRWTQ
jgi:hypothetical protein